MKTARKFLAVLMCAAMLFGSVAMLGGIASAAYEKQEGYLNFKVRDDEAVLVSCAQNAMGEITVPAARRRACQEDRRRRIYGLIRSV